MSLYVCFSFGFGLTRFDAVFLIISSELSECHSSYVGWDPVVILNTFIQ